jgi:peptidoglycan/LPS O-acetylase OafA/YrhL
MGRDDSATPRGAARSALKLAARDSSTAGGTSMSHDKPIKYPGIAVAFWVVSAIAFVASVLIALAQVNSVDAINQLQQWTRASMLFSLAAVSAAAGAVLSKKRTVTQRLAAGLPLTSVVCVTAPPVFFGEWTVLAYIAGAICLIGGVVAERKS